MPATKRFLSMEPLLGPVSFEGMWVDHEDPAMHENMLEAIDWVIVGGESGPGARPMHPDWARWLRDLPIRHGFALTLEELGQLGEAVYLLERFRTPAAWMKRCITSGLLEQAEPDEQSNSVDWTDAFPIFTTCPRLVPKEPKP